MANPTWTHLGAPIPDVADPMAEGVGAAAWAKDRADRPDLTVGGEPRIQPMSVLSGWHVDEADANPIGMTVVAGDGKNAGEVSDIWVDRSEPAIRFLQLKGDGAPVLLPMGYCRISGGQVHVKAIYAEHFGRIPRPKANDRITLLEEDKVVAFFAGGYRYADASRNEPLF